MNSIRHGGETCFWRIMAERTGNITPDMIMNTISAAVERRAEKAVEDGMQILFLQYQGRYLLEEATWIYEKLLEPALEEYPAASKRGYFCFDESRKILLKFAANHWTLALSLENYDRADECFTFLVNAYKQKFSSPRYEEHIRKLIEDVLRETIDGTFHWKKLSRYIQSKATPAGLVKLLSIAWVRFGGYLELSIAFLK